MQNMLQLHKQPFYFQAFNQEKQTLCSYKDLYMNFIAALFLRIENSGNVHQCPSIEQRQIMIYSLKRLLFNIKMNYLQLEILKVMMLRKEKPGNEQYILCDSMTIKKSRKYKFIYSHSHQIYWCDFSAFFCAPIASYTWISEHLLHHVKI